MDGPPAEDGKDGGSKTWAKKIIRHPDGSLWQKNSDGVVIEFDPDDNEQVIGCCACYAYSLFCLISSVLHSERPIKTELL